MKKSILILSLLALSIAFAGIAYANTATANLQIQATVIAPCTVSTANINFGNVTGAATVDANGSVTVNCPSATTYTITLDKGLHLSGGGGGNRHVASGSNSGVYELYKDAAGGTPWGDWTYAGTYSWPVVTDTGTGSDQPHTVYGRLFSFSGIAAGTVLTDTVTVTVYY